MSYQCPITKMVDIIVKQLLILLICPICISMSHLYFAGFFFFFFVLYSCSLSYEGQP